MKYERKGNIYYKMSWLKRHEKGLWTAGCVVMLCFCVLVRIILGE